MLQNLKSFKFEHADCTEYDFGFLPRDFGRSLAHVRHSVENLWLCYNDDYFNGQDYEGLDKVLGSLAEYPVLKSLYISAENLIGGNAPLNPDNGSLGPTNPQQLARILLASIESLTLANVFNSYCPGAFMQLKNLIEPSNLSQFTPRLREC